MNQNRWAIIGILVSALFSAILANGADEKIQYPAPRFPSYIRTAKSVDEIMPYARALARGKTTQRGAGFGDIKKGQSVMIIAPLQADDNALEALRRALDERGVKPVIFREYELAGVSKADNLALEESGYVPFAGILDQNKGYMEAIWWFEGIGHDAQDHYTGAGLKWLKENNQELYNRAFPSPAQRAPMSAHMQEIAVKMMGDNIGAGAVKYMKAHPEIRGVFWGPAIAFWQRYLHPMEDKMLGNFSVYHTRYALMNEVTTYPDDLWLLVEQQVMDPFAYVDKVTVEDPEGTNVVFDVNPQQSAKWANGAYIRSHVLLYPDQVGGRYPYSFVDFPSEQKDWVPVEPRVKLNGVIAGTTSYAGYYPRIEMHYKDGTMVEVKGGGLYGDLLRQALKYPGINSLTYPFMQTPGYWHLFEIATGTHPKYFRDPDDFSNPPVPSLGVGYAELRSGVFHFGLGAEMVAEPGSKGSPVKFWKFADDHNLPRGHGWHVQNYFPTYKVHLRNSNRWVTVVDRGHLKSLDSPEVRALASRYGDPKKWLEEDWIPEIPGINAPGKYEDYAKDPYTYTKSVIDKVRAGTYEHMYPPVPGKQTKQTAQVR